MRTRGYLTQCTGAGGYGGPRCNATARLAKPARWRCDACEKAYGPLPKGNV